MSLAATTPGRPYRIRVTRIEDNQEIYNQVKTFTYDPDFPQQLKNEIILPNTSSYKFEITSVDEPMLVYTRSYNRVNRGPNYSVYGIHNITCTTARTNLRGPPGGCHKKHGMIIRDKSKPALKWHVSISGTTQITSRNSQRPSMISSVTKRIRWRSIMKPTF